MLKCLQKPAGTAFLAAVLMAACGGGGGSADVPLWLPTDVKLADIDGDGRLDVVTLSYLIEPYPAPYHGQVNVWRQAANGLFSASQAYPVGFAPWNLAIADIDGDGAPDLVISDVGSRPGTIGGSGCCGRSRPDEERSVLHSAWSNYPSSRITWSSGT